jgi:hypothetical protein
MSRAKGESMKLRLSTAARRVLEALVAALALLLVFGVSAAAAGPYYLHRPPVTVGNPSVTVAAIAFALVLGIEAALIVYLALPRRRRAASLEIDSLRAEREPEETRKAA